MELSDNAILCIIRMGWAKGAMYGFDYSSESIAGMTDACNGDAEELLVKVKEILANPESFT